MHEWIATITKYAIVAIDGMALMTITAAAV